MDLSTIEEQSIRVDVKHPATGEDTGFVILVVSLENDRVIPARRAITNKALRTRNKSLTAEQIADNEIDLLAAATVGWEWNDDADWGGEKLAFSPANVKKVLRTPWVKKQVDAALEDDAAFFRGDQ
ncbi:hypothetical protein [Phyllobacterium calauticae]|uniref:hypothetical protein n=1 Tax=Phyllobacterium calauticae TaxID=2817027 RepID=UPI001CBE327F|nr:hypothetical protein [Phyllobacterium calauticae]MBZ3690985.1 hypothetical protein [Phyllobacterium calauticae]